MNGLTPLEQRLLDALRDAVKGCPCSMRERDSGHLVECFVPHVREALDEAEALETVPVEPPQSGDGFRI